MDGFSFFRSSFSWEYVDAGFASPYAEWPLILEPFIFLVVEYDRGPTFFFLSFC